jgi:hypothetical protein
MASRWSAKFRKNLETPEALVLFGSDHNDGGFPCLVTVCASRQAAAAFLRPQVL